MDSTQRITITGGYQGLWVLVSNIKIHKIFWLLFWQKTLKVQSKYFMENVVFRVWWYKKLYQRASLSKESIFRWISFVKRLKDSCNHFKEMHEILHFRLKMSVFGILIIRKFCLEHFVNLSYSFYYNHPL